MLIAGLQKLTLLDYPGKIAALIFTQGCNFACGYCHNAEMIPACKKTEDPNLDPENILKFLKKRQGLLDGVVISGGEPTLQPDLAEFMKKIKNMGFLIKLDTNGSNPKILQSLIDLNLIDYIAMDVKHSRKKVKMFTGQVDPEDITTSLEIIKNGQVDYEFRSTILPFYHQEEDIHSMGELVKGCKRWFLQNFRPLKTLNPRLAHSNAFRSDELSAFKEIAEQYVDQVGVRQ